MYKVSFYQGLSFGVGSMGNIHIIAVISSGYTYQNFTVFIYVMAVDPIRNIIIIHSYSAWTPGEDPESWFSHCQ